MRTMKKKLKNNQNSISTTRGTQSTYNENSKIHMYEWLDNHTPEEYLNSKIGFSDDSIKYKNKNKIINNDITIEIKKNRHRKLHSTIQY